MKSKNHIKIKLNGIDRRKKSVREYEKYIEDEINRMVTFHDFLKFQYDLMLYGSASFHVKPIKKVVKC